MPALLEALLIDVLKDLRTHYATPEPEPMMSTAMASGVTFKNVREFHQKVTRLQGWSAVWMALLSHAIVSAFVADENPLDVNAVPHWITHLCQHWKIGPGHHIRFKLGIGRSLPS